MPAVKRSASSELVGRPSVHHSSVTLYTPTSSNDHSGDVQATDLPDTRSKRAKIVKKEVSDVAVSQRTRGKRVVTAVATSSSIKLEHNETEDIGLAKVPQRLQRRKAPSKPKVVKQSLDIPHPAPGRWREAYDTIKQMRASIVAPVDTMGCDQAQYQETDPKVLSDSFVCFRQ